MTMETEPGIEIEVLSSELKAARLAYSEESSEKNCYDKELSKMMMKKVSKTTDSSTVVTMVFAPEDLKSVLRMVYRHSEHMRKVGHSGKKEDYMKIYNKMESQAVPQGLPIR